MTSRDERTVRIEDTVPLSQKTHRSLQRVFDGPVHSKSELSLSAGDIDPFPIARHLIKYGNNLKRGCVRWESSIRSRLRERLSG